MFGVERWVMDSLRIALEISMTKISQPRRRRRRHSLLFWYLLPLLSPVSIKAADTIEAAADMVVTDDTDTADTADAADAADANHAVQKSEFPFFTVFKEKPSQERYIDH